MQVVTPEQRLSAWLEGTVPEGQHLEFKEALHLGNRGEKRELLKDLTAMGNGGGGTLVFGISERKEDEASYAQAVCALADRTLLTRVANLVLDCVRPTLIWRDEIIETVDGYVLLLDVEPSPLGPYMVQLRGENRYYRRVGDNSVPMDEAMVRDLYAAAASWQRDLRERWAVLGLPLTASWEEHPTLTVTGVPIDAGVDRFDPVRTDIDRLRPSLGRLGQGHHGRLAALPDLIDALDVWADGFHATADAPLANRDRLPLAPQAAMRIHRDGAFGFAINVATGDRLDPVRQANAVLAYAASLWAAADLRSVHVRVELAGFGERASRDEPRYPRAPHPAGAPPIAAVIDEVLVVRELLDSSSRHRMLLRFANRIMNAFGRREVDTGWEHGLLRTPDSATRLVATRGLIQPFDAGASAWRVAVNGSVRDLGDLETRVAWWRDGALLDLDGQLMATTEFPTCSNLPANFAVAPPDAEWSDSITGLDPEELSETNGALRDDEPPICTGSWAGTDPIRYMRQRRSSSP